MRQFILVAACCLFLNTAAADNNIPDPVIRCQDNDDDPPRLELDDDDDVPDLYGDDEDEDTEDKEIEPPAFVKAVIPPKGNMQPTNRLIFIFDCSSSMGDENRFKKAIAALKGIMQTPMDDGRFMMIGFKEKPFLWPGVKEKGVPKYWAKLPSLTSIEAANKWLDGIDCDSYTDISPAILKAFEVNKNDEKLSIILFTDGHNTWSGRPTPPPYLGGETPKTVVKKILAAQATRVAREKNKDPKKRIGSDRISIFVLGVGKDQNIPMLSAITKAGKGFYFTEQKLYKEACPACIQQSRKYAVMPGGQPHYMGKPPGLCEPHKKANEKAKKKPAKAK